MANSQEQNGFIPRIESLKVNNYRALHDFELKRHLATKPSLLGPNGSGKSTVFLIVFAFSFRMFFCWIKKKHGIREED